MEGNKTCSLSSFFSLSLSNSDSQNVDLELVRNANSWAHITPTESETWGWGMKSSDLSRILGQRLSNVRMYQNHSTVSASGERTVFRK